MNQSCLRQFTTCTPMLLHVPAIDLAIDSRGTSGKSVCLMRAISYICCEEMFPADWCPGRWLASFTPSAFLMKNIAGGVFMTCMDDHEPYTRTMRFWRLSE